MLRARHCQFCLDTIPPNRRIDAKYCRDSCKTLASHARNRPGAGQPAQRPLQPSALVEQVMQLESQEAALRSELAAMRARNAELEAALQRFQGEGAAPEVTTPAPRSAAVRGSGRFKKRRSRGHAAPGRHAASADAVEQPIAPVSRSLLDTASSTTEVHATSTPTDPARSVDAHSTPAEHTSGKAHDATADSPTLHIAADADGPEAEIPSSGRGGDGEALGDVLASVLPKDFTFDWLESTHVLDARSPVDSIETPVVAEQGSGSLPLSTSESSASPQQALEHAAPGGPLFQVLAPDGSPVPLKPSAQATEPSASAAPEIPQTDSSDPRAGSAQDAMPRVDSGSTDALADWVLFQRLPYVLRAKRSHLAHCLTLQLAEQRALLQRISRRWTSELYRIRMQHPRIHLEGLLRCASRAHDSLARERPTINPKEARQYARWLAKNSRLLTKLAEHIAMSVFDQERPLQLDGGSREKEDRSRGMPRPHALTQPAKIRPPRSAFPYDPLEPERDEEEWRIDESAPNAQKNAPSPSTQQPPHASFETAGIAGARRESMRPDPNHHAGGDPLASLYSGSDPVSKLLQKSQDQPSSVFSNSSPVDHISKLEAPPPDFVGKLLERPLSQRFRLFPHSESRDSIKDLMQRFPSTQDSDDGEDDA